MLVCWRHLLSPLMLLPAIIVAVASSTAVVLSVAIVFSMIRENKATHHGSEPLHNLLSYRKDVRYLLQHLYTYTNSACLEAQMAMILDQNCRHSLICAPPF